ncbi:MAG: hypothetical protein WBP45_07140, partial [Daejeonella sp.]
GRGDEVLAELQITDPSIDPDKVEFRNGAGETISSKREGNTYTIQLLGAPEGNDKEVYAFYQTGKDKNLGINLGKLNIASFKKITKKVMIVPVNGAGKGLSESALQNSLNEVYKQAIVEWDVELAPNFVPATHWDTNQNGLDVGNSSAMSAYTAEQKALAGMYKKQAGLKDGTYYIFLINKFSDTGQQGYMVRGGQVGFCLTPTLSKGEGAISRGLAHELGHGAFSLQHTWDVLGDATKEKTANLMDYGSANSFLWHYQWKYMRNPDIVFRPFETDEEGAYLKTEYFVAINGYPIQIKDINIKRLLVAPSKKYPSGTLYGYRNKSDEEYLPYFQNDQFMGYQNQKTQAVLKPVLITGKKELTVQFLETTSTKCVYRLSTGKYAIPANINTIVPENIIKPVKRDTSINITNEQCQDLALDPLTGPFASTESSKITNFLSRVKANTGIKINLIYLDINDPEYAKKLEETKKKNAEGITLIAKMQENKNQQPGLNIIPFEFVDFEVNDPCTFDKISKAHQEFIKSSYFKIDDPILSKVREVGYISYKTLFAHLECATSEEIALKLYPDTLSVTHKAWQITYGFTNGLVSNFDLLAAIEGTKELGKGILEMNSDNYLSYAKDMVGLLTNPPNISDFQEPEKLKKLFTKISPPTLRNDLQALDKGVNVVNGLWKFYATQGNYWRSGQLAATVIPIVLSGGELAATKIKGWIKGTDKAANLLKAAKKLEQAAGNTVNVIDEAGNVKTIALEGDELVVRAVAKAGDVVEATQNLLVVTWKNNIKGFKSATSATEFWNNTSKSCKHLIDEDFYLKFDNGTGSLLFANHKKGEILGFYEGLANSEIVAQRGLQSLSNKLKIYHGISGAPSYVVANVSSGAKIITNPKKTTTIIGNYTRYPYTIGDMKTLVGDELLGNLKTSQFGAKKGGFNILNVSDELIVSNGNFDNFWNTFNKPWLEEAIKRGDDIWSASNPLDATILFNKLLSQIDNLPSNLTPGNLKLFLNNYNKTDYLTGFGKETKLLSDNGYVFDLSTKMFKK